MSMHLLDLETYRNTPTEYTPSLTPQLRLIKSAHDCLIVPLHKPSTSSPAHASFAPIPAIPQEELDAVVARIKAGYYTQTAVLTDIAQHLGQTFRAASQ